MKDVLLKAFVRKINMRNNSTTLVVFSFCIVIKDKIIKLTNSWQSNHNKINIMMVKRRKYVL